MFYFRMAVPKAAVPAMRRAEVKTSLRTNDLVVARMRTLRLSEAFETFFKEVAAVPGLTFDEIDARVRAYMQDSLNKGLELARLMPGDRVDINAEVHGLRGDIKQLRNQLAAQSFAPDVVSAARMLLAPTHAEGAQQPLEAVQHASEGIARARIENARILAARLEGKVEETALRDPLFTGLKTNTLPLLPGELPAAPAPVLTLERLGQRYLDHAKKSGNEDKTLRDYDRSLRFAYAVWGAEKPVAEIKTPDVVDLCDVIGSVPPNYAKLKSKKSIHELAAANTHGPKLEPATQEKLYRFIRSVLRWASNIELIPKMPGANVKLPAAKKISKKESRLPYSAEQLKTLFSAPTFTGHLSHGRRFEPGAMVVRDGKFWVPGIALYSGMRLGEIVQLLKSDVKQHDGVWYFDVSKGEDEKKRIKTEASKRRVPIHQSLLDAGILAHIEKVKKGKRLFEDVKFGADGYPSANFTKYWGRYGRKVGAWTKKHTFHSFRHNCIQAMREAGVPKDVRQEIVGHEGEDHHDNYGTGLPMAILKGAIDKAKYPGVAGWLKA